MVIRSVRHLMSISAIALIALASLPSFSSEGTLVIFQPEGQAFEDVVRGLADDLDGEMDLVKVPAKDDLSVEDVNQALEANNPDALILLGNSALNVYKRYQTKYPTGSFPPVIATAALFVDQSMVGVKNVSAIRYEVPAVTSLVNVRSMISKPLNKVGVIYRSNLANVVKDYVEYCKSEGIELITAEVPVTSKNMPNELSNNITFLLKKKVDALLVLNDNRLLTSDNVRRSWLPILKNRRVPVVVGLEPLVSSDLNLGAFAFVPDHYGLGIQTASMVWDLLDNDWEFEETEIQEPLSVKKTVNVHILNRKLIPFSSEQLNSFDTVIED